MWEFLSRDLPIVLRYGLMRRLQSLVSWMTVSRNPSSHHDDSQKAPQEIKDRALPIAIDTRIAAKIRSQEKAGGLIVLSSNVLIGIIAFNLFYSAVLCLSIYVGPHMESWYWHTDPLKIILYVVIEFFLLIASGILFITVPAQIMASTTAILDPQKQRIGIAGIVTLLIIMPLLGLRTLIVILAGVSLIIFLKPFRPRDDGQKTPITMDTIDSPVATIQSPKKGGWGMILSGKALEGIILFNLLRSVAPFLNGYLSTRTDPLMRSLHGILEVLLTITGVMLFITIPAQLIGCFTTMFEPKKRRTAIVGIVALVITIQLMALWAFAVGLGGASTGHR